jgi:DNA-directed RNA polymerase specialized sigma24 family protein
VHACEWRSVEVAEAMRISASAVATHLSRGLERLRDILEVTDRA